MREKILHPLHTLKPEAHIYLYSLQGWEFQKNVSTLPSSTALGREIEEISHPLLTCAYSSSFFQYCKEMSQDGELYAFFQERLPKKTWALGLSSSFKPLGKTVDTFFDGENSLFDCLKEQDLSSCYAAMQYVEGYYLIRESIKKALQASREEITICLLLPNDEYKYYKDFSEDLNRCLTLDFPKELAGLHIRILLRCFTYGNSLTERPYIDTSPKGEKMQKGEIAAYFDYLHPRASVIPRDILHGLNDQSFTQ